MDDQKKTQKRDLSIPAWLQQLAYLLSDGRDVTIILASKVPGAKPKCLIHGSPKDIMTLAPYVDLHVDEKLSKLVLVEIVEDSEISEVSEITEELSDTQKQESKMVRLVRRYGDIKVGKGDS